MPKVIVASKKCAAQDILHDISKEIFRQVRATILSLSVSFPGCFDITYADAVRF